jgi:aryl-alcohol dehydrogenase-like predicted oxidoreductase
VEYRRLTADRAVSVVGFGCWAIGGHGYGEVDDNTSIAAVRKAWDAGVNLFDTADIYGFGHSETVLSEALGNDRHSAVIATKFGVAWDESGRIWRDSSAARAREALEASLRRLKIERIPLYQVHWPDGSVPLDDTLAELERQREAGKIEMIGVSNFGATEILSAPTVRPTSAQYGFNLVDRTRGPDIARCQEAGIGVLAYGVLARGILSGKFESAQEFAPGDTRAKDPLFRGEALRRALDGARLLRETAHRAHVTPAQVAIRWAIDQPGITSAIVGAKTPEQVSENVLSLRMTLVDEDRRQLDEMGGFSATKEL